MSNQYSLPFNNSRDLRRLSFDRRPCAAKIAARQICRRYGVSQSHARLIADIQGYGGAL